MKEFPLIALAKNIIDRGSLGRIFHYRANFLQDWTISSELPQGGEGFVTRLDVDVAGSGVTGDLLAHCIDTAMWLNGPIIEVSAMTETFVKERTHNLTGKIKKVGIDDACAFLAKFENGSLAIFESTRYARGHKALYTFEINGGKFFDHGIYMICIVLSILIMVTDQLYEVGEIFMQQMAISLIWINGGFLD